MLSFCSPVPRARATGASFLAALLFLPTTPAHAYCRTKTCELSNADCAPDGDGCSTEGSDLRWSNPCLTFAVHEHAAPSLGLSASELEALISRAFITWRDVLCPAGGMPGFDVVALGSVACGEHQTVCGGAENNDNVVSFRSPWPSTYQENAAAITSVTADLDTGEVVDADLEFHLDLLTGSNMGGGPSLSTLDLERIALHEVGHFLGLSHSLEPGALMSASYQETLASGLTDDDINGVCALFPPTTAPFSCSSQSPVRSACAAEDLSTGQVCTRPVNTSSSSNGSGGCSWARNPAKPTRTWVLALLAAVLAIIRVRSRPVTPEGGSRTIAPES